MDDTKLFKDITDCNRIGLITKGRPKIRWTDQVISDLTFKASRLLYLPQCLTLKLLHGSHIAFIQVCFVWLLEQTENFALHNISRLVLYNRCGVFTTRYGLSPYIKQSHLVFKVLKKRKQRNWRQLVTDRKSWNNLS
jgi:hypothetical protein